MAFYIYPKGVTGEQLAWMMEYVDGVQPIFIDDGDEKLCFEVQKDNVSNSDVVLIALSKISPNYVKNLEKIVNKLKKHNLRYVEDAVLEYVRKSICKLKLECRNEGLSKIVCLVMSGFANNKHYGRLGDILAQRLADNGRGGGLLYVCSDKLSYQQYLHKNNIKLLYISYEYLVLINFVDIFVLNGAYDYYREADLIYIGHALVDYKNIHYEPYMGSGLCIASPKFRPITEFPSGVDIIECGYLGFDNIVEEIDKVECKRDSVLFLPYCLEEMYAMEQYIVSVLEKYRVIFRFREGFDASGLEFCKKFLKNKNFHIDHGNSIDIESYARSFCMVCSRTTSKNSFPILSLCPVVVLPHREEIFGIRIDEAIGINCEKWIDVQEMLQIIEQIYNSLYKWNEKILEYRDANIYNFGKASEYLADYLIERFRL